MTQIKQPGRDVRYTPRDIIAKYGMSGVYKCIESGHIYIVSDVFITRDDGVDVTTVIVIGDDGDVFYSPLSSDDDHEFTKHNVPVDVRFENSNPNTLWQD